MEKGSGTRSGLLWEVERLLRETEELPQVLLMENVPAVHGQQNINAFRDWIDFLNVLGYSSYYEDLNARNYGVAQNRERCFMVSLLGEYSYHFPKPIPLDKCIKDYLQDEVPEKYYIGGERAQKLIKQLEEREIIKQDGDLDYSKTTDGVVKVSNSGERESALTGTENDNEKSQTQLQLRQEIISSEERKITLSLNGRTINKEIDVANTIYAGYYKGYGTGFTMMNGVAEWKTE